MKVAGCSLVCGVCIAVAWAAFPGDPGFFDGDKLFADVVHYSEVGEHRTATEVDHATGRWLFERLERAGLEASYHDWTLHQFFLEKCGTFVGEDQIECFPYWLPRATGPEPVRGRPVIVEAETDPAIFQDRIGVVDMRLARSSSGMNTAIDRLARGGALAAVFISHRDVDMPVAMNARPPYVNEAAPIPAVIVGGGAEPTLLRALRDATEISVSILGRSTTAARARNVIGTLRRGHRWVVVSTPYSGWFHCAGERGSGLAIWLSLAEWAARSETALSWLFVANSGHELDYMGAERSLESGIIPDPGRTWCWLHLGAAIGVVDWRMTAEGWRRDPSVPRVNVMTIPEWVNLTRAAFDGVSGLRMTTEHKAGELGNVARRGYRAFGLIGGGSNPWGHTRGDTPESAEPATLELIARATAATLEAIERDAGLRAARKRRYHDLDDHGDNPQHGYPLN